MKKTVKKKFIILSTIFLLSSCNGQSKQINVKEDVMEKLTLIFCISGGTRAHIISINSENELSYKVGSFYSNGSISLSNIKYNHEYKEIKKKLSNVEVKRIRDYYSVKKKLLFNDTKIVKDSWEYHLFINGEKIAFGNKSNFNDFPESLKEFINYIIGITGDLYEIPGMS